MVIELKTIDPAAYIYKTGTELFDMAEDFRLKVKITNANPEIPDVDLLNEKVPNNKAWKARVTVEIFQTDVG